MVCSTTFPGSGSCASNSVGAFSSLTGSTLRPRTVEQKASIAEALREKVWPLLEGGQVKPVIDSTYALAQADQAHARMETSQHVGKIMLEV